MTAGLFAFTRIPSRAIVGVGTSLNTNCPPYSNNLTAFMRALLESAQWAPRARAPQNSEHAVRIGGRDVRGEPWDGVGPPTTCNTSQCTYRWRIRSGDRWRRQPSRNHGTRCARSNNDVVVAGFEIFPPRGLICCDCEDLSVTAAASEV